MEPFLEREACVLPEWIDYNGHMNVAFYVLVFDHSTDALLDKLGLGKVYRETEHKSFFVVESHVNYENEVKKDDLLVVKTRLLGYDTKRLHIFHEMFDGENGGRCATNEIMALHVDMEQRRTAVIPDDFVPVLKEGVSQSLREGFPENCGRAIRRL